MSTNLECSDSQIMILVDTLRESTLRAKEQRHKGTEGIEERGATEEGNVKYIFSKRVMGSQLTISFNFFSLCLY